MELAIIHVVIHTTNLFIYAVQILLVKKAPIVY